MFRVQRDTLVAPPTAATEGISSSGACSAGGAAGLRLFKQQVSLLHKHVVLTVASQRLEVLLRGRDEAGDEEYLSR